mgnify:CR=1 FL=1
MITYKEFELLKSLKINGKCSAQYIYEKTVHYVFQSKEEIESILCDLEEKKYITNGKLTEYAEAELESCKVKNAVILAAGGSDISAKSVYSMPKGLYVKNGETLIERQIKQLKEAGINDIAVVIGYKQEMYFFLQEKWGVELIVNPDLKKNNVFSLYCAVEKLDSTYICNCDNYFEENPFSLYEYNSYHATVCKPNSENELLVKKNKTGKIIEVYTSRNGGECIYGHAFFDKQFSKRFKEFLREEICDFRVSSLFWEEFVARHVDDLDMYAHEYSPNVVFEFDSIQQIQNIDSMFLGNVSKKVNSKICEVLFCKEEDISNIEVLQKGLTNVLFTFVVKGQKYIFRYPAESSSNIVYRKNECCAQKIAAQVGVDNTYVYIDDSGIKISKFIDNCKNLNNIYYKDVELMKELARKIKAFHDAGHISNWKEFDYDPVKECERLMKDASVMKGNLFELFKKEWEEIRLIQKYADKDGIKKTMCHNDINGDNCLLTDNSFDVIDWEFAGYNDPAYDFGRVIAGYEFDDKAIDDILEAYFGRKATDIERLHWIAYMGIHCWYYVGWALYKESINESSRDWMLFFYKQVKRVIEYVLPRYKKIYGEI